MSTPTLTKASFEGGIWHGILRDAGQEPPELEVLRDGTVQPDLSVTVRPGEEGAWDVRFHLPPSALGDAAVVFVFRLSGHVDALADLTILSGNALSGDPRRDLAQLRAELDLVKRVLRRDLGTRSAD